MQVQTQKFRDPLLSQGRERSEEERTILRCMTGYNYTDKDIDQVKLPPLPLVPLGRQGTPRMASRQDNNTHMFYINVFDEQMSSLCKVCVV